MKWPIKSELEYRRYFLVKELDALYKNKLVCSSLIRDYEQELNIVRDLLHLYKERQIRQFNTV